jgi:hypothetical protein
MTDLSNKQTTSASNKQLGDSQSAESFDPGEFIYTDNLALLRLAQQSGDLNSIPGWSEYGNNPWIAFALHEGAFVAGGNSYAEVHEMLIRTVRELLLTSEDEQATANAAMLLQKAAEELVSLQFQIGETSPKNGQADKHLD